MVFSNKSKHLMKIFTQNKNLFAVQHTKKTDEIFTELYYKILGAYNYVNQNKGVSFTPFLFDRSACNAHSGAFSSAKSNGSMRILNAQRCKQNILSTQPLETGELYEIRIRQINTKSQITLPLKVDLNGLPESIQQGIIGSMSTEISYSFKLFERKIKIIFIVEEDSTKVNIRTYNKHVEKMIMWLWIIHQYADSKCSSNLVVYIYFTPLEKRVPLSKSIILDETNVNTAITTGCLVNTEIVIYRKEEWFKVFIHETCHSFGIDFSNMNNTESTRRILNLFPVNSKVNLFESYTEFWAETMNVSFCSFMLLKNKNNLDEFLNNVQILMNTERNYSFFQLVKTLNFMGLQYKDLYSLKSDFLRETLYKENTNVLSYYVIKTILMNNYPAFLYWCKTNNPTLLQFNKTASNQAKYCEYIEKNYKTRSMLEGITNATQLLNHKKTKTDIFLLVNMRMSLCELG